MRVSFSAVRFTGPKTTTVAIAPPPGGSWGVPGSSAATVHLSRAKAVSLPPQGRYAIPGLPAEPGRIAIPGTTGTPDELQQPGQIGYDPKSSAQHEAESEALRAQRTFLRGLI